MSPHRLLFLCAVIAAATAHAALEGPGVNQVMKGIRIAHGITLDGKLDEPEWLQAPAFSDFVQSFPAEGAAPTERTEVRFLYDDDHLYVGVICFDSQPSQILRRLGRRDHPPASDSIQIAIDSTHSHRTAYSFTLNAAGVQQDGLFYDGSNFTTDWDSVWDGAAADRPDGWSAELVIPLAILRFPEAKQSVFGIGIARDLAHKHEIDYSVLIPRSANQAVQRFGHLVLEGLKPKHDLELTPYLAGRASLRPQFSDTARPHPRLLDPSADLGLDLKAGLLSDLTLNAALNPDFGQVEADQLILNLSTFEQFFPEKRPFFTQGMELFQPVGLPDFGPPPQTMFYSRRVGLISPIFAAAKVTGTLTRGVTVGALDALVGGFFNPNADEANPDRGYRFRWQQPLHVAPTDAYPSFFSQAIDTNTTPVPMNYFALVSRKEIFANSQVGGTFTAATPLTSTCSDAQAALDPTLQPAGCLARGGNALALDWNFKSGNGDWIFTGQVDGSQTVGGPPLRTLADGTPLRRGDLGFGTYFTAGKVGGEPYRLDLSYEYESPKLELNPSGFQRAQNFQLVRLRPHLFKTEYGKLQNLSLSLNAQGMWSTDGRGIYRGSNVSFNASAIVPGYHSAGFEAGWDDPFGYDLREAGDGIPIERRPNGYLVLFGGTDSKRAFSVSGSVYLGWAPARATVPHGWNIGWGVNGVWRPHSRVETQLTVNANQNPLSGRWVSGTSAGDGTPTQYIFGDLDTRSLSVTFRQLLVITPRLTLQAYAQLFAAYGHYGPYYTVTRTDLTPIRYADMVPIAPLSVAADPSFHEAGLNLNVVLRWEYRLGSTLFLVYSRSQTEFPYLNVIPPSDVLPGQLPRGPATDTVLLKWSYWWDA